MNTNTRSTKLKKIDTQTSPLMKLSSKSPIFTPLTAPSPQKSFNFLQPNSPNSPITPDSRKVYLSGIPQDMTKSRIKHCIQNFFGKIEEVKIIKHDLNHPLRYGFVTFKYERNVVECLAKEKIEIDGNFIYFRRFKRKRNKPRMNKRRKKIEVEENLELEEGVVEKEFIGENHNYINDGNIGVGKSFENKLLSGVFLGGNSKKNESEGEESGENDQAELDLKAVELELRGTELNMKKLADEELDLSSLKQVLKISKRIEIFGRHNPKNLFFRKFGNQERKFCSSVEREKKLFQGIFNRNLEFRNF